MSFLVICLAHVGLCATLTLKIDGTCHPKLTYGKDEITVQSTDLFLTKGERIFFVLDNPSNRNFIINIQIGNKQLKYDSVFKFVNQISTDETLKLNYNGNSFDLSKGFSLLFGCLNEKPFETSFQIKRLSEQQAGAISPGNSYMNNSTENNQPKSASGVYTPGSMVYDALKLSNVDNLSEYEFRKIIKFYFPNDTIEDINKAISAVAGNPFLKKIINEKYKPHKPNPEGVAQAGADIFSSLSLSSVGGLNVTNIADGLAIFLVKRTKQELSIAFFDKFKRILEDSLYIDLRTVFPQTYNLLFSMGNEIYNYERYIQNLREAFKNDINNLNENLPGILENHKTFFRKYHTVAASLKSGCYIAGCLQNHVHPGDILSNYPVEEYLKTESKNFKGSVKTLQLLSTSLRDTSSSDSTYWVNIKYIRQLVNEKNAFTIYFGLLYQHILNDKTLNGIEFENSVTLKTILKHLANCFDSNYDAYKMYILGFAEKINEIDRMIKAYSKPANDSLAVELYAKYFNSSVSMIEYCTKVGELPYLNNLLFLKTLHDTLADYFDIVYSTADLVSDINRRNYSSVINHLVHIYDVIVTRNLLTDKKKDLIDLRKKITVVDTIAMARKDKHEAEKYQKYCEKLKKIKDNPSDSTKWRAIDSILKLTIHKKDSILKVHKNQIEAINTAKSQLKKAQNQDTAKNVMTVLSKYSVFAASIATAKSSQEVAQTIETAALPTGSARIKRESVFNVALNAYCGAFIGYECIKGIDAPWTCNYQKINSFGVTAPIGISVSRGHSIFFIGTGKKGWEEDKSGGAGWSSSIFFSIIDIGALASFRFTNDTSVSTVPAIQLKDILSPGIFFSLGIPKCPISLNMGWQLGPILREVNVKENTYKENYTRISISVCVDIPLLNICTGQQRKY
jgi:hypothetical protein